MLMVSPQMKPSPSHEIGSDVSTLFDTDPTVALKHHFGFEAFRPLQADIVADVLAGRDVFALLPTGGGKSLCFQLPAVMTPGLTVVVSPLIALMKDQVDALTAAGIEATYLNSSLEGDEARRRLRNLEQGAYRLLYLAPERLALPHVIEDLQRWNVARFAIDEAHCISEWGHDFRPDYRRLAGLRRSFPSVPILALTATATGRVREDIVGSLGLREPKCYVASFDRPNLSYRVVPKNDSFRMLLSFVRERGKESGIVYAASRRQVDTLAEKLAAAGIAARPYHAGLDPRERARNQERFVRDDTQVICATIAFGMGIDKPNVRYVVHYDLPKNLESYYQETGRAGRDGIASECVLFYGAGDVSKQLGFIDEKEGRERELALDGLRFMQQYAEVGECRRRLLLAHFGETTPSENCGNCDNCVAPRKRFDGTLFAQKFLSNVVRVRQAGGFSVGLNHLTDILVGKETEKVRDWNHDSLTTYGIGRDVGRTQWLSVGRELVRLGLLRQTPGLRSTIELTDDGRRALVERTPVEMTEPMDVPPVPRNGRAPRASSTGASAGRFGGGASRSGDDAFDESLFEELRTLRKSLADERDVPAYVIFPDTTLRAMARDVPKDRTALRAVPGVGDKKLVDYGDAFLAAIAAYVGR